MEPNTKRVIKIEMPKAFRDSEISELPQFVMTYTPSGDKRPYKLHDVYGKGEIAATNNPEHWSTLDAIIDGCNTVNFEANEFVVCPSIVLTNNDKLLGFDFDLKHIRDPLEFQKKVALAIDFMRTYGNGQAYIEKSVSGKGFHALAKCNDRDLFDKLGRSFRGLVDQLGLEVCALGWHFALTFGYHNTPFGMREGHYTGTHIPVMSELNMMQMEQGMRDSGHRPVRTHATASRLPLGYQAVVDLMDDLATLEFAYSFCDGTSLDNDLFDPTYPYRTMKAGQRDPDMSYVEFQLMGRIVAQLPKNISTNMAVAAVLLVMETWCFAKARSSDQGTWTRPFPDGPPIKGKRSTMEAYRQYLFHGASKMVHQASQKAA